MPRRPSKFATGAGLFLAWGGTALLAGPAAHILTTPDPIVAALLGQAALWALFVAVLAIVRFWERESWASLWLRPFLWQSIVWGVGLAVVMIAWSSRRSSQPGG